MNDNLMYFKEELSKISSQSIKSAVDYMYSRAPKYFMEVNAASNPNYCKDRDGNIISLKDHTKQVTRYMILLLSHPMIKSQFDANTRDKMIAASLIHDLVKFGINANPESYIRFDHPLLVAQLVDSNLQFTNPEMFNNLNDIIGISVAHNGPWTTNSHSNVILPSVSNSAQYYMHMCDWLASRSITWIDTNASLEGINVF